MIKKIAWDTFKNTGNIDAFLEFKQIENIENQIKADEENGFKTNFQKINEINNSDITNVE